MWTRACMIAYTLLFPFMYVSSYPAVQSRQLLPFTTHYGVCVISDVSDVHLGRSNFLTEL